MRPVLDPVRKRAAGVLPRSSRVKFFRIVANSIVAARLRPKTALQAQRWGTPRLTRPAARIAGSFSVGSYELHPPRTS